MALPKLNVPEYTTKIPSSGVQIKYRPFLVKEEKLLYLAMETGEQTDMISAVKNILKNCTNYKNIDQLTTFDIEYLFLKIRTRSVGENVEVNITCPDDEETTVPVKIPLDEIEVTKNPKHNKEIKLTDNVILTMGYPSLDLFIQTNFSDENFGVDQMFEMAASCAESIADENQVYLCKDTPKKELLEFFENMNTKQFQMIQEFFDTMPKLSYEVKVTNPKTQKENTILLEGLSAFFA